MRNEDRELDEHRLEFLKYLEMVQPTEVPNRGRESHLNPGCSYKPHEEIEDRTDRPTQSR